MKAAGQDDREYAHDETILELNHDLIEFYLVRQQNMMTDYI